MADKVCASDEASRGPESLSTGYEYDLKEAFENQGLMCRDLRATVPEPICPGEQEKNKKNNKSESILHKNLRLATTKPVDVARDLTTKALAKVGEIVTTDLSLMEELEAADSDQSGFEKLLEDTQQQLRNAQKQIAAREVKLTEALLANNLIAPADPDYLAKYGPKSDHTPKLVRVNYELREEIVKATAKAEEQVFAKYISSPGQLEDFLKKYRDIQSHKVCNDYYVRKCTEIVVKAQKKKKIGVADESEESKPVNGVTGKAQSSTASQNVNGYSTGPVQTSQVDLGATELRKFGKGSKGQS